MQDTNKTLENEVKDKIITEEKLFEDKFDKYKEDTQEKE